MNEAFKIISNFREKNSAPVDTLGCENVIEKNNLAIRRFQILIMLVLSTQTRDEFTYAAIQKLHSAGLLSISKMAQATEKDIEKYIFGVGFHHKKSKYLKEISIILYSKAMENICRVNAKGKEERKLKNYSNEKNEMVKLKSKEENNINIEYDIDEVINYYNDLHLLLKLPGVGKKIAYLFLETAFNLSLGIGVDTHIHRIVNRLGYKTKSPEETRLLIQKEISKENWKGLNKILVGFGQTICTPRNPKCTKCGILSCKSRLEF